MKDAINATRRKFLGFLGAAPLVAKEAAEQVAAGLAGMNTSGIGYNTELLHSIGGYGPPSASPETWTVQYSKAADWVKLFGIPAEFDEALRRRSRNIHNIDADIAIKKSWSLAVKVQHQAERNYNREIERIALEGTRLQAADAFKLVSGFSWPWAL